MRILSFISLLLLLVSCKSEKDHSIEDSGTELKLITEENLDLKFKNEVHNFSAIHAKQRNGVNFIFKLLTAKRFLNHAGQTVSIADEKSIENESVMIFEIENTSQGKSVFDNKSMVMLQDEAVQFLAGNLTNELWIEQGGKKIFATGSQYEGTIGALSNKLRVIVFFTGLELDKEYTIKYDDPIFNAGLLLLSEKPQNELL